MSTSAPTAAALAIIFSAGAATVAFPNAPILPRHFSTSLNHLAYARRYHTLFSHALYHGSWAHLLSNALVASTHALRSAPGFLPTLALFFGGAASGVVAFLIRHVVYAQDNSLSLPLLGSARTGISPIDALLDSAVLYLRAERREQIASVRHIGGSAGALAFAGWELVDLLERLLRRACHALSARPASIASATEQALTRDKPESEAASLVVSLLGADKYGKENAGSTMSTSPLKGTIYDTDDDEEPLHPSSPASVRLPMSPMPTPPVSRKNSFDAEPVPSTVSIPGIESQLSTQSIPICSLTQPIPSLSAKNPVSDELRRADISLLVDLALISFTLYNEVNAARSSSTSSFVGVGNSIGNTAHVGGFAFGVVAAVAARCFRYLSR